MTDIINQNKEDVLEEQQDVVIQKEVKEEKIFEPSFTIREMLEAGVHFGHRTARWNPKMIPYIYGVKNELHIIDLTQTAVLLSEAARILREIVKRQGKILFVCTKKQGAETVKEVAFSCGQYFVTTKWLGGMLTNWKTVSKSIKTLKEIDIELADESSTLTKKEKLMLDRKRTKLENQLGGIKSMTKLPDLVFVIDTPREALAITEAKALNIPVMAIVDTNSDPDLIDYTIPGNDDSIKAIKLYMNVIEQALKDGIDNIPVRKEENRDNKKKDFNKVQSRKASKNENRFKKIKLPATKEEVKTPSVREEVKTPSVKKEAKTPSVKGNIKTPAVEKEVKTPSVK